MQGMHSLGAKGHSPGTADKAFTARGPMWAPRLRSRWIHAVIQYPQ